MGDYALVATGLISIGSEALSLFNKHYSTKVPPSVITLAVECCKFGWSLLNGNYFKEKDVQKQRQKADLLAQEVKTFYLELMKNQQAQETPDEKDTIKKLQEEHALRLQELEIRLGVNRV